MAFDPAHPDPQGPAVLRVAPDIVVEGPWKVRPSHDRGRRILAHDPDGEAREILPSGLSRRLGRLPSHAGPDSFRQLDFHPRELRFVKMTGDGLLCADLAGTTRWLRHGTFTDATVLCRRQMVWMAHHLDDATVEVQMLDWSDGQTLASARIPDRLEGSGLLLSDTPGDTLTLELGAGQDGITVWEIGLDDDRIMAREMFPGTSYITPAWSPSGHQLVAWENDRYIVARFSYPRLQRLAAQDEPASADDAWILGGDIAWAGVGSLLVPDERYRIWSFDPATLKPLREVVIDGWEPAPANVLYPRLAGETDLMSAISGIDRVGPWLAANTFENSPHPALLLLNPERLAPSAPGTG